MTKKDLAILACRIFALYAFLLFLLRVEDTIGVSWGLIVDGPEVNTEARILALAFLTSSVLVMVLAALIWQKAEWLAKQIFPGEEPEGMKINVTMSEVQIVVFSVVGLVTIVHSLPQIGSLIVQYKLRTSQILTGQFPSYAFWQQGTVAAVEFMIGVGLLFGARGLSGLLRSLRKS